MPGITIGWEYLTGCCVATDSAIRERAEWPPHPGRVFMAMAAAWFETGEDETEGQALRWLEQLGDPELGVPDYVSERNVVNCYVPVNDVAGPSKLILQSAPGHTRDRKERTFPTVWVGSAPCFQHWPNASATEVETHRPALARLCSKVTRIGHSSSLVCMWVVEELLSHQSMESWAPNDELSDLQVRRISEGTLDLLTEQYNRKGREQHRVLSDQIAAIKAEKPKGKGASERKAEIKTQLEALQQELEKIDSRDPIRPKLGLWTGYSRSGAELEPEAFRTAFDSEILILTQVDGPRLPLSSTSMVTQALRGTIMRHSTVQPPPAWVSGHLENGQPLRDGQQHLALISLPFVGSEHADGHLLGVGLVFPRTVSRSERGQVLGRLLIAEAGQPREIVLTLGSIGVWTVRKRDWMEQRRALQPETWTADGGGAYTWETVTPVVLDRFPKSDPVADRQAWETEVAGIVSASCQRIGLPLPAEVAVGTTSWQLGSPRATVKRRSLRGHPEISGTSTSLGDGFPMYPTKGGNGARPQLHVRLRFKNPLVGPILLGAGRFLGYGLFKPLRGAYAR